MIFFSTGRSPATLARFKGVSDLATKALVVFTNNGVSRRFIDTLADAGVLIRISRASMSALLFSALLLASSTLDYLALSFFKDKSKSSSGSLLVARVAAF